MDELDALSGALAERTAPGRTNLDLIGDLDRLHSLMSGIHCTLFARIAEIDRRGLWKAAGCRDIAEWLAGRFGISNWAASRWVKAAYALEDLPLISRAFEEGTLNVDKVIELTRFATPDTEGELLTWSRRVKAATIRRRADLANRPSREDHTDAQANRYFEWEFDHENVSLRFEGCLPAEDGSALIEAVERQADLMISMPGDPEDPESNVYARRADALVALASAGLAEDQSNDTATVIIHADIAALRGDGRGCEIEGGPVIHPDVARRLSCDGRLQTVLYDGARGVIGIGRTSPKIPRRLKRLLRHRDKTCTFPGCGAGRFLDGHHVRPWDDGGPTDLDNLTLTCRFHHKLVHEHGWRVVLDASGAATWLMPDGLPYDPGSKANRMADRGPPRRSRLDVARPLVKE